MNEKMLICLVFCLSLSGIASPDAFASGKTVTSSKIRYTVTCPTSGMSGGTLLVSIPSGFESPFPTGNTGLAEFNTASVVAKVVGTNLVCSYPGLTTGFTMLQSTSTASSESTIPACPSLSGILGTMSSSFSPGSSWTTSNFRAYYESSAGTVISGVGKKTGCTYKQSTTSSSIYQKTTGTCTVNSDNKSFLCSK